MATHPMAVNPHLMRSGVRPAPSVRVSRLGYVLLMVLLAVCTLNLGIVFTNLYPTALATFFGSEIPINPLVVALLFPPIFLLSNTKRRSVYFVAAWFFWLIFSLCGFLGAREYILVDDYRIAQRVFKIWITMIAIPWLVIRTVPEEKVPQITKFIYLLISVGAVLAVAQALNPAVANAFQGQSAEDRGAGPWQNPNNCGAFCGIGVFLSMMYPLRWRTLNYSVRIILLCGLLASLSRASILTFAVCCLVYGVTTKKFLVIAKVLVVMLAMAVVGGLSLGYLKTISNPAAQQRIDLVAKAIRGSVTVEDAKRSRFRYWKTSFQAIKTDWFIGLGHGQTSFEVAGQGRKATHNYYLEVWANSGIVALLAFLALLTTIAITALKCRDMRVRAAMCALITTIVMLSFVNNGLMAYQPVGAVFGLLALIGCVNKKQRQPMRLALPVRGARLVRPTR